MGALNRDPEKGLVITENHWNQMAADVEQRFPEEACGLVAGIQNRSTAVVPIRNMLHSPVRFRMDPREQLEAFNHFDRQGWALAGIYHSHPQGPSHPSPTDIEEAYYPGAVHLIWSQKGGQWQCDGFIIQEGQVIKTPLRIEKPQQPLHGG